MTDYNRLHWQCRRGMLELDTLLQDFLQQQYGSLSDKDKSVFEQMLGYPDQVLFEYLMGNMKPVDRDVASVVERIRNPAVP